MRTLVEIALRNLLAARRRSALLGTAIALVTLMLVLLLGLSKGIEDNMVEAATTVSAGHVNVAGFFKSTSTSAAAPIVTQKAPVRAIVEENVDGIEYIVERDRGWGKIISDTGTVNVGLNGLIAADEARFFAELEMALESEYAEDGRDEAIGDPRRLAEHDTILLFASHAKQLRVRVGDELTIKTETNAGVTNTVDVEVVAVARDMGFMTSFTAFLPRSTVLELYQLNEMNTGALWIYLDDIDRSAAVMNDLRGHLADAGYVVMDHDPNPFFFKFERVQGEDWSGQQLDLTMWKDEVSYVAWILAAFDSLSVFLTLILVAIIAVGIMNAMWTAVRERTAEIGTMRAIGMQRGHVLLLFLIEAVLLGLLATGVGAGIGALLAVLVNASAIDVGVEAVQAILLSNTLSLSVTPQALVGAMLFITFFTALAAVWPSLRAAALRPVDALRHTE